LNKNAKEIVKQMTLEEKASLCSGKDFWHLKAIERLGLKPIMVTDGPHGLRKQAENSDHLGINNSVPATCFPTASATACSFDRELLIEMGTALAEECLQEQVAVLLGPGANIKRSPLCGRNFEYISEDPYLTGEIAAALIKGVESQGIGTSLKHFAANNQEKCRMTGNSVVDERALREIYLAGFETAVKKGKPSTIMCAYNQLNGTFCSENKKLLTDILRTEWGFEGIVMTDWGAVDDRVDGLMAGLDLEMPSSNGMNDARIVKAVKEGKISEEILDKTAERLVSLILKGLDVERKDFKYSQEEHQKLSKKIAEQSAVLLKNHGGILPADKKQKAAVIGEFAKTPRYQGSGSSKINPLKIDCAWDAFVAAGIEPQYAQGYSLKEMEPDNKLIKEAVEVSKNSDIVFIFAGLPDEYESEGFDRTTLSMPHSHNSLIEAVGEVCENVVVILFGGAPVEMPWISKVKAVLMCYLGGQSGGSAVVDLLYGDVNPSGKLAETYPLSLADTPCYNYYPETAKTVQYRESIFVGYRYYDSVQKSVLFPFGHGLSYTSFDYSNIFVSSDNIEDSELLTVSLDVTNTGEREGKEIVQIYVTHENPTIFKAPKELKSFEKIFLMPGEKKKVTFTLDKRSFAYYNTNIRDWHVESGKYIISVGASSRDIRLTASVNVASDDKKVLIPDYRKTAPDYYNLPEGSLKVSENEFAALLDFPLIPDRAPRVGTFNINSTMTDIKDTLIGKLMFKAVNKKAGQMAGEDEELNRMISEMINDMPLRSFAMLSNGEFTIDKIEGIVDMLNHRYLKGIKKLMKK